MKKITLILIALLFSPLSFAEYAKGTIEEVKICGTGNTGSYRWIRTLQFKVDNKWFGTYADNFFSGGGSTDLDNNQTTSLVMMAYAQNLVIEINATDIWSSIHKVCGSETGHIFDDNAGDYIKLSR